MIGYHAGMKHSGILRGIQVMKRSGFLAVAMIGAALMLCSGPVLAGPLGELEIHGEVRLTQMGGSESVTLRNTTYSLFAGDRIATGDRPASLRLNSGDSIAVGPHSELQLQTSGHRLDADLSRGSLVFLLNANGSQLRVNGGDIALNGRLGMIERGDTGMLRLLQDDEAVSTAELAGLSLSDGGISVSCKDSKHCDNVRPMSISP